MSAPVLVWFKRDLRVSDHPALAFAATQGPIIPLYIVEPGYWQQDDVSGRQFAFLQECVSDLDNQLAQMGLRLCVRVGEAVETLETVRRVSGARVLVSHEETGNQWTFSRDKQVAQWARAQGVHWHQFPQSGVVRRLDSRDGWAKRRNQFLRDAQQVVPAVSAGPTLRSDAWPALLTDDCPGRQPGGRQHAPVHVAQEVGAGLARGEILFRQVSPRPRQA